MLALVFMFLPNSNQDCMRSMQAWCKKINRTCVLSLSYLVQFQFHWSHRSVIIHDGEDSLFPWSSVTFQPRNDPSCCDEITQLCLFFLALISHSPSAPPGYLGCGAERVSKESCNSRSGILLLTEFYSEFMRIRSSYIFHAIDALWSLNEDKNVHYYFRHRNQSGSLRTKEFQGVYTCTTRFSCIVSPLCWITKFKMQ